MALSLGWELAAWQGAAWRGYALSRIRKHRQLWAGHPFPAPPSIVVFPLVFQYCLTIFGRILVRKPRLGLADVLAFIWKTTNGVGRPDLEAVSEACEFSIRLAWKQPRSRVRSGCTFQALWHCCRDRPV